MSTEKTGQERKKNDIFCTRKRHIFRIYDRNGVQFGKRKIFGRTNCYKNVIFFKKGVAICKHLCYNMATYIRAKE